MTCKACNNVNNTICPFCPDFPLKFDLEDVLTEIMVDELTIKEAIAKYHLSDEESILLCFALAEMSKENVNQ